MRLADLPEPWRDDPYLLGEHAHTDVLAAWPAGDALVAVLDGAGHGRGLYGLGEPRAVARLCGRAVRERPDVVAGAAYASLVRGAWEALTPGDAVALGLADAGATWDWMWTTGPLSADPGHAERLPLGPATVAEVAECLARAHPTASTPADDDRVLGWWGARAGGRLQAVVGAIAYAPGLAPYLVSLGVDPAARGQGLAGTVLAAAVRDCLEVVPDRGPRMVTLGLYASNAVARRVYLRLGFRLEREFESRRRPARPAPAVTASGPDGRPG